MSLWARDWGSPFCIFRELLRALVDVIQAYRCNILYTTKTMFHRNMCSLVQKFMDNIETMDQLHAESGDVMEEDHPHALEAIRIHLDSEVSPMLPDGYGWRGKVFRFHNVSMDVLIERLGMDAWTDAVVLVSFHGSPVSLSRISLPLSPSPAHSRLDCSPLLPAWSGILDCSVPKCVYALGAKITCRGPLRSTLLYVGFCYDLNNDYLQ